MIVVVNSTMGSSLPSNALPFISKYFNITQSSGKILPISIYLVGYIVGPLLFGPLSEAYGRKFIMISTFFLFTLFTLGCAVAPNWGALLIFRFLAGVSASSPIAINGGMYADLFDNPVTRGRAMATFIGVSKPIHSVIQSNTTRELALAHWLLLSYLDSSLRVLGGAGYSGLG